jgi:hypothetical protein
VTEQRCDNCRFARVRGADKKRQCLRHAPQPYNAMIFYFGELLRDVAWSTRALANIETPSEHDDLSKEATEAKDYAVWPEVELDDWCGEWQVAP